MITSYQELFTRFQQRLSAVGGESHLVRDLSSAATIITEHEALTQKDLVCPPHFSLNKSWGKIVALLSKEGIAVREATSPVEVADAAAGLSSSELAVAETGSVLLAENALEARVVSMLTLTHFILVPESNLVPMLDEVGARLQELTRRSPDQRRYISLVTGPSRTADIERTLSIGVQGPKAICVLIVQNI